MNKSKHAFELEEHIGGLKLKCHGDNKDKQGNHKHNPIKHILHMIICCGLPIVIIGLLPFVSNLSPSIGRVLGFIAPFICPIMMILMITMMYRGNKGSNCCDTTSKDTGKSLELN